MAREVTRLQTPVLFLIFNRPETTRLVLDAIRQAAPPRLFVAADGPRPGNARDETLCEETLSLVKQGIDWSCQVDYLIRKSNLGCGKAPNSAVSWFFDNVDEGIILEDDCRPVPEFFPFCESLLQRYRGVPRVAQIGGFNCQFGRRRGNASYYFSRYFHIWGWATWRRAWAGYDVEMRDYPEFLAEGGLENLFERKVVRDFWQRNFDTVRSGTVVTWDYQWAYHNFKKDALAIVPNVNLVHNIGFGDNATHTIAAPRRHPGVGSNGDKELVHPLFVLPCREADDFTYRNHLGLGWFHAAKQLFKRVMQVFWMPTRPKSR
jgi:hypothetical protein